MSLHYLTALNVTTLPTLLLQSPRLNDSSAAAATTKFAEPLSHPRIPPYIFQTWHTTPILSQQTPLLYSAVSSWTQPPYAHVILDDSAVEQYVTRLNTTTNTFLATHSAAIDTAYHTLTIPTQRIDLWRLLIIYQFGGLYVDIDSLCNNPISEWLDATKCIVTGTGQRFNDVHQWILAYEPQSPVIEAAILQLIDNVLHTPLYTLNTRVEYYTGPIMFNTVYHQTLQQHPHLRACAHQYADDEMGGNVVFKVAGIDAELDQHQRHPHWTEVQRVYEHGAEMRMVCQWAGIVIIGLALLMTLQEGIRRAFRKCKDGEDLSVWQDSKLSRWLLADPSDLQFVATLNSVW